jgi:gluconolactonase
VLVLGDPLVLAQGFDSTEGPAFDRDGNLFFVNWLSSQIMKRTPDGEITEFYNTGGIPAGLAFHPDGSLWVADEGENIHGLLRITADGRGEIALNEFNGRPLNGANDLVFDRQGILYFSDPWGSNGERPIGGFYRLFPDGRVEQLAAGLAFPNGVALNADESAVYLAETYRNRILRFPIATDGSIGEGVHWADTALPSGPDGMAFDATGRLFVAHYGAGQVDVYDQTGKLVDAITTSGSSPTNCAFGGPDRTQLVVTEIETQSVYQFDLAVAGQRLNDR